MPSDPRIQEILKRLVVLVPAFNEEAALPGLLQEIAASLPGCDVCVVDDGSSDRTAEVAGAAGARVLRLPCNCGVGVALRAGFIDAIERGYGYMLRLDGDGQHPPGEALRLIRFMADNPTDLVIGTRYGEGSSYHGTPFRRFTLKILAAFVSLICRKRSTDPTSGFWLISRPLLYGFAIHFPNDYPEAEALALLRRQGFSYDEVPVAFRPRAAGETTINAWASIIFALKVFLALFVDRLRRVDVRGSAGYIKRMLEADHA